MCIGSCLYIQVAAGGHNCVQGAVADALSGSDTALDYHSSEGDSKTSIP